VEADNSHLRADKMESAFFDLDYPDLEPAGFVAS
jgi:hypothetical protein